MNLSCQSEINYQPSFLQIHKNNGEPFQLDARAARLGGRDEERAALQRRVVCLFVYLIVCW
jgi:hypothetical protein